MVLLEHLLMLEVLEEDLLEYQTLEQLLLFMVLLVLQVKVTLVVM